MQRSHQERTGRTHDEDSSADPENSQISATPEEIIENSYLTIRKSLAQELLFKIKSSTP